MYILSPYFSELYTPAEFFYISDSLLKHEDINNRKAILSPGYYYFITSHIVKEYYKSLTNLIGFDRAYTIYRAFCDSIKNQFDRNIQNKYFRTGLAVLKKLRKSFRKTFK